MSLRRNKWLQRHKPIVYKFEEQAEEVRKQNKEYWDQLFLPKRKSKKKSPKLVLSAYRKTDIRDEGKCQHPGCNRTYEVNHHHIIYRSQGGKNHVANLITLCPEHHTEGKDSPHQSEAWRRYWEGWAEELYPEFWREIREGQKIQQYSNTAIGG